MMELPDAYCGTDSRKEPCFRPRSSANVVAACSESGDGRPGAFQALLRAERRRTRSHSMSGP